VKERVVEEDFVKVASKNEMLPSHMKKVQLNGDNICLVNVEGKYYAINNICTHEGGPLADGTLDDNEEDKTLTITVTPIEPTPTIEEESEEDSSSSDNGNNDDGNDN